MPSVREICEVCGKGMAKGFRAQTPEPWSIRVFLVCSYPCGEMIVLNRLSRAISEQMSSERDHPPDGPYGVRAPGVPLHSRIAPAS
jgi:hypothetical protein